MFPPSLQHITSELKKNSTIVKHPYVIELPGLLLQVILAAHGVDDHQLIWTVCGQSCWKHKKLSCHPPSPQHITSYLKNSSPSNTSFMSESSLVFSSRVSSPPTVSSNTNSHVLNAVGHFEKKSSNTNSHVLNAVRHFEKKSHVNHYHQSISYHIKKDVNWCDTY